MLSCESVARLILSGLTKTEKPPVNNLRYRARNQTHVKAADKLLPLEVCGIIFAVLIFAAQFDTGSVPLTNNGPASVFGNYVSLVGECPSAHRLGVNPSRRDQENHERHSSKEIFSAK
jgi:hypothetical protein